MTPPLLALEELRTYFPLRRGVFLPRTTGVVKAVDGVSLTVAAGETVGLVGESGCGKSTLARTVVRLAPPTSGRILFEGRDLCAMGAGELRRVRPRLQMIFQDPYASLNPRMTVFDALAEPMVVHGLADRAGLARQVGALMETVGLAARLMRKYPHEFSGGQRQRIAIARALALRPALVIADEPVSALDVSVQAQILNLLAELRARSGLTLMLISHDLAVVHYLADRIAVMYLGKVVELGPADAVFHRPRHPYTQALIGAILLPEPGRARTGAPLSGDPPSPLRPPTGCPFHPRCPHADEDCARTAPALRGCGAAHEAACLRIEDIPESPRAGIAAGLN